MWELNHRTSKSHAFSPFLQPQIMTDVRQQQCGADLCAVPFNHCCRSMHARGGNHAVFACWLEHMVADAPIVTGGIEVWRCPLKGCCMTGAALVVAVVVTCSGAPMLQMWHHICREKAAHIARTERATRLHARASAPAIAATGSLSQCMQGSCIYEAQEPH